MLASLAALALALAPLRKGEIENVVVVVMDEVGIDQLRCYDDQNAYSEPFAYAHTPNIDRLAREGARFTQFRTAPLCSPSRAMLLTGRYPFRTGIGAIVRLRNSTPECVELGNPRRETILPAILPGRRAAVGKWHLGLEPDEGGTMPAHPQALGFPSWRGTARNLGGDCTVPPGGEPSYRNFWWWEDGTPHAVEDQFLTIYTRERACDWMAHGSGPMFLYLAFNACHEPLSLPPEGEHGFGDSIPAEHYNTLARANLECLDRQLGLLLAALPPRTCVFALGDNGTPLELKRPAPGEIRYPAHHPLHEDGDETRALSLAPYDPARAKRGLYESGVRVPLIVWGPEVEPGTRGDLVDMVDLFATIAELLEVAIPSGVAQDSQSFLGPLVGVPGLRTFSLTEHFEPNGIGAIERSYDEHAYIRRDGPHLWKVIRRAELPDQFFDVAADPFESTKLGTSSAAYRETVQALEALLATERR